LTLPPCTLHTRIVHGRTLCETTLYKTLVNEYH
jgi:hypothetical protein